MVCLIRYFFTREMKLNIEILYDKIFQPQLINKIKKRKEEEEEKEKEKKNLVNKNEEYFENLIIDIRCKMLEKNEDYRFGFNSIFKSKYIIIYLIINSIFMPQYFYLSPRELSRKLNDSYDINISEDQSLKLIQYIRRNDRERNDVYIYISYYYFIYLIIISSFLSLLLSRYYY